MVAVAGVVIATLVGDTVSVPEPSGAKPTRTCGDDASAVRAPVLVLFSDMRNHTKELDLESEKGLAVALKNQNVEHTISDLRDVQAFALGVDGADSTRGDWQRILAYWQQFFSKHGADIKEFSPLRQARVVAAQ